MCGNGKLLLWLASVHKIICNDTVVDFLLLIDALCCFVLFWVCLWVCVCIVHGCLNVVAKCEIGFVLPDAFEIYNITYSDFHIHTYDADNFQLPSTSINKCWCMNLKCCCARFPLQIILSHTLNVLIYAWKMRVCKETNLFDSRHQLCVFCFTFFIKWRFFLKK